MWIVWDKKSNINGSTAEAYLARNKDIAKEETVFLKVVNGRVNNVEGKSILSTLYSIDPTLPDDEFIARYEYILANPDPFLEPLPDPEPMPEPEPTPETDTTTYAELAQVYAEGVNSIE
jgi:hypothetical protein